MDAQFIHNHPIVQFAAAADQKSGDIVQCPHGEVGVVHGLNADVLKTGEQISAITRGTFDVTTAVSFNAGDDVQWDDTGKTAVAVGDFSIGKCLVANGSATTVRTVLNA